MSTITQTAYLYKNVQPFESRTIKSAKGIWLTLEDGRRILDATSGAVVAAIGHGDLRVKQAIVDQLDKVAYCHPGFYQTDIAQDLATYLVNTTHGTMVRALLTGSGGLS